MKAYMTRKGLIAKIARFLEQYIQWGVLHRIGWKEIPITTSGTGDTVQTVSFDVYFS